MPEVFDHEKHVHWAPRKEGKIALEEAFLWDVVFVNDGIQELANAGHVITGSFMDLLQRLDDQVSQIREELDKANGH